jgi:electron transfer flavoprotein alpha subunit
MSNILVYAELHGGEVTDMSHQCLAMARKVAGGDSKITAVVVGSISHEDSFVTSLASYGADTVETVTHPELTAYISGPFKKALLELNTKLSPKLILLPSSTQGNDLASALASAMNTACVVDAKEVTLEEGRPIAKRTEFDGKITTSFASKTDSLVATVKDGAIDALEPDSTRSAEHIKTALTLDETDFTSRVINRELAKKTVNLKAAKVIITAGAGIGSKDNYELVEKLAEALGGEVGATRPVVDAGWASADRQIGQTGATVKPDVYIACGVSGAVQHMVGLADAKNVIAINTDAKAPIFKYANYCINGDIKDVIPKLIDAIK